MIKKYINEKIVIVLIYCEVQIYFKNHSNDYQTWWSTQSYITYEFIVPFQLYMKSSIHMISQKTCGWSSSFKQVQMCEYIKVFWKNTIIWEITRIVRVDLCQESIFSVFQNAKWKF
jgi:hypothetical protein